MPRACLVNLGFRAAAELCAGEAVWPNAGTDTQSNSHNIVFTPRIISIRILGGRGRVRSRFCSQYTLSGAHGDAHAGDHEYSRGSPRDATQHVFGEDRRLDRTCAANSWVLNHNKVSGQHAQISFRSGVFYIQDMSRNGVSVNSPENRLMRNRRTP